MLTPLKLPEANLCEILARCRCPGRFAIAAISFHGGPGTAIRSVFHNMYRGISWIFVCMAYIALNGKAVFSTIKRPRLPFGVDAT
jgi:hypothetical protein